MINEKDKKTMTKALVILSIIFIGLIALACAFVKVDQGERAVILRFGEAITTLDPGLHFKIPIVDKAVYFETRIQRFSSEAKAATFDLQDVNTKIAVNFRVDNTKVLQIYEEMGTQYLQRVVDPAIQEIVKAVTANYRAEELITNREEVRRDVETRLQERLQNRYIFVEAISLTDFSFSESFSQAIEEKVTAEQQKLKAEIDLERIEVEALQVETEAKGRSNAEIERARGQAEAIRIIQGQLYGSPDYIEFYALNSFLYTIK